MNKMINPILWSLLSLTLGSQAPAAEITVPGQKEAIATLDEMLKNMETIKKEGPSCADTIRGPSKCPKTISQNASKGFIEPYSKFLLDQKQALSKINLAPALNGEASKSSLAGASSCQGAPEKLVAEEKPKKEAVDNAIPAVEKIAKNLQERHAFFMKNEASVSAEAKRCKDEISSNLSIADVGKACLLLEAGAMPRSRYEALARVFSKDCMHASCSANVLKAYENNMGSLYAKLQKNVGSLKTYLTETSEKFKANIEQLDKIAKNCGQQQSPAAPEKQAKKEPESKVSEADKKPMAKTDQTAVTGQPAQSEEAAKAEAAPKVAATTQKAEAPQAAATKENAANSVAGDVFKEVPPPNAEKAATEDNAESPQLRKDYAELSKAYEEATRPFKASEEATAEASDVTGLKPLTADDIAQKDTYQSNSTAEIKPTQAMPDAQTLSDSNAKQMKTTYQQDDIFTKRDLDFNSSKDTKYIQNALNQIRTQNGQSTLSADGVFGSRTTAALDQVMQDPAQKTAFLQALKQQMSRTPASK